VVSSLSATTATTSTVGAVSEKLFSVGERLPARLREEIVSRGAAVEPYLRRLIEEADLFEQDARGKGWAPLQQ
jgi:hypothetical protein